MKNKYNKSEFDEVIKEKSDKENAEPEEKTPKHVFVIEETEEDQPKKIISEKSKDQPVKEEAAGKEEDEKKEIDESKIIETLKKFDSSFGDIKSLDDLSKKINLRSEAAEKETLETGRNAHVQKVLYDKMNTDGEIKRLLKKVDLDKMPSSTKEEWEEFASEHPYEATQIENRLTAIRDEESELYTRTFTYDKKVPEENSKRLNTVADKVEKFTKEIFPKAEDVDLKPLGEAFTKFLNEGKLPGEYFDSVPVGNKTYKILNPDRMFAGFVSQNHTEIAKLMNLASEKQVAGKVKERVEKLKNKTSNNDIANVATAGDVRKKVINPLDNRDLERVSEDDISSLLEPNQRNIHKHKNY
jgi:hypothetical protein